MKFRIEVGIIVIISMFLLWNGLTRPMITLEAGVDRQLLIDEGKRLLQEQDLHPTMMMIAAQFLEGMRATGKTHVFNTTQTILETAKNLYNSNKWVIALLILLFSTVIPILKICLLLGTLWGRYSTKFLFFNSLLSKWSMADVFALAVILACMVSSGSGASSSPLVFGTVLHAGFYWFLGYSIFAIGAGQWLVFRKKRNLIDSST